MTKFYKMKLLSFEKTLLIAISLLFWNAALASDHVLRSPDEAIVLTVSVGDNITYAISVNGKPLLENSELALILGDQIRLGDNPRLIREERRSVDRVLFPELRVKSASIADQFNELTLNFRGRYKVKFRAYNNGIAYRFETNFRGDITVQSETAIFGFTGPNQIYFPREEEFHSHNERSYEVLAMDSLTKADLGSLPVLVSSAENVKALITESGLLDYPGMWLRGAEGNRLQASFPPYALEDEVDHSRWTDNRSVRVSKKADYIAKTTGRRSFPWRIIGISKEDRELLLNQLSYQLAEPSRIADDSWIKPGKIAWDWWNYNNVHTVDFRAGVNTETYKYYIDFAAEYGLEYVILDEGWYELGDVMKIVPEVDVRELIRYGEEKGVGIILWVVWSTLDEKLEEALDAYQAWGAKGVKVDFMQRDDQWMVNYYERIAAACAERKLLVDFHGSYKPSGLRRTYPNVMTREGVRGAEHNKWADYITPEHNVTLPFIRMVAGPMDYTPGAMINTQAENFNAVFNRPMSIGTRCHQLAMYAVFESPLQMLCDSPSNYLREKECTKFISEFPAIWDDTKVLHAKLADHVAVARRSGDQWFIGAMTDGQERTLDIDLSFLEEGTYTIEIFEDGINADRFASDYRRKVREVTNQDIIPAKMVKGGGWAARIYK